MDYEARLRELGYELPPPPPEAGNYIAVKEFGSHFLYISGTGGDIGAFDPHGRLGAEISLELGQKAAENCALNILSAIKAHCGSLNAIRSFVKLLVLVASTNDFTRQPEVANGATNLLTQVFGEKVGRPSRSAIGVNVLPDNIPVEIEGIVELVGE